MRRTLLAAGVSGTVIAVAWLQFEQPLASTARAALLVALAVAAATLPSARLRAAGSVVAALVAVRLAFGVWVPLHPVGGSSAVWTRFGSGFLDFYSTHLPFEPRLHTDMTEVVLFAVFAFTLAVGLCVAARKPLAAALLLLVGAGWPATLSVPTPGAALAEGAAILGAALIVLAAAGSGRISRYAVPFALALVLGGILVGTATASNHAALPWQSWNVAGAAAPENVSFVWDARYRGLHWPKAKTTMLEVRSTTEPAYLRAAVLDDFDAGGWVIGPPRAADSLEPAAAFRSANQTRQDITIEGLADTRLLGGSVPVRFAANEALLESERGFAEVPLGFGRGFQYTAWSYDPTSSARALSRSPAHYPAALLDGGMLDVGNGISAPAFGTPGGAAQVAFSLSRSFDLPAYVPLARLAAHVTRGATTPYAAVTDLERWFLVGGGFTYSNHPRIVSPPLVGFATTTRSGYCQYFAGAMALMLRYVGIPARVAVGFAGPTFKGDSWTFTDHDAHAWVEVWFKGYGWIPFDPTPARSGSSRARLIAAYTHTSSSSSSGGGASTGGGRSTGSQSTGPPPSALHHLRGPTNSTPVPAAPRGGGGFPYVLIIPLLVVGLVGGIALAKETRRRVRRRTRDPRLIAAACRDELVSFLLDQGIESPSSATVRELGLLAHRQLGADADDFVAATTAARFGRPEAAAAAARVAREESGPLFASCRRFLTRRDRMRGLVSLRSIVRAGWSVDGSDSLGSTPS